MNIQFRIFDVEKSQIFIDCQYGTHYTVGNSYDNDVFVPEWQDHPQGALFFEFSVENDLIYFWKGFESIVYIDFVNHTKNLVSTDFNYEIPCLFELLNVQFALCDASDSFEKWYAILAAKPPEPSVTLPPTDNEPTDTEKAHLESLDTQPPPTERTRKDPRQHTPSETDPQATLNRVRNGFQTFVAQNKKGILVVTGFVIIVCLSVIIVMSLQKSILNPLLLAEKHSVAAELKAIKKIEVNLPQKFNGIKFMSNQKDMVIIEGVVKNQDDKIYLEEKFKNYKKVIQFKLLTGDEAVDKINNILNTLHVPLITVAFDSTTYRIYLYGLLDKMDIINDIEIAASNQVPEVSDLDTTHVYSLVDVNRDVDELIKNNVSSRLTVSRQLESRTIKISGYLNPSEVGDLQNAVSILVGKYQGLVKVQLDVKDALASLPFKIVAVNTGGFAFFMTSDGEKVFEGGEIGGMKVDKISPTEIVFSGKFPLILKLDDIMGTGGKSK